MHTETGAIETTFHGLHVTKYDDGDTHVELADLPLPAERDMGSLVDLFAYLGALAEEYLDKRARELLNEGLLMLVERRNSPGQLSAWLSLVETHLRFALEDALRDDGKPVPPDFDEDADAPL